LVEDGEDVPIAAAVKARGSHDVQRTRMEGDQLDSLDWLDGMIPADGAYDRRFSHDLRYCDLKPLFVACSGDASEL
jgi:hypothetical protein